MKKLRITAKLVFCSTCILIGLGLAVTVYSVSQLRGLLYQEMVRRVEAQTQNWIEANISPIILSGSAETLNRLVGELKRREGIAYVILLDAHGKPRAATRATDELIVEPSATEEAGFRMRWRMVRDTRGFRYIELSALISASGTGMSPDLDTMFGEVAKSPSRGEVRVGVDRQEFDRGVSALVRKNIALAAVLIVLAVVLSFVFARQMVTPITLMARAANQIAAGNLSERVQRGTNLQDEVGDLVRNFNQMADRLAENREEMNALHADLERKVAERTLELEDANRRLQELDQLKSDFLSTVSHELRTPLTSIKAFAQILLDSPLDEPTQKRYLDIIDKESDRLTRLITDLLDLAKIERREMSWSMVQADLQEIVAQAVNSLVALSKTQHIRLDIDPSRRLPVWVDVDRIQQVVTNLVGNAFKFSPESGRIGIRIDERTSSGPHDARPGRYFAVAVSDTGPGVSQEEKERIFKKFYHGPRKYPGRSGTGLGLAISREIVLHHQGEIWVESEPGAGSTFYFTLPLWAGEEVLADAAGADA
jgi:signal transduction histidine kinase